ncbi:MAG: sulfatase-like hydrolase/transferase, partial [Verrucomicrobia bacterium]|nr:sulfatase-like hydrolase/transferase [Verrucomicrobiota bacterium]
MTLVLCPRGFSAQPNILLIIADDIGADSSPLYNSTTNGATFPPTPTIDSLAKRAVVFRNAWACPECSPSRAAMLTGRYPFRTGVPDAIAQGDTAVLSATEYTLPKAFSNSAPNYHLAHFGKWHLALGANTPKTTGGWSNYVGCLSGALVTSYTNWTKTSNNVQTTGYTNYATTDLVNDATNWIATRGTNPWFAWIAFNAPHAPLHVPPTNLAPGYATNTGVTANRRQFEAMMQALDTETARLLTAVDTNNTHIIFLGDNGTQNNVLQPPYPSGRGKSS